MGRPLMERLGKARGKVRRMYCSQEMSVTRFGNWGQRREERGDVRLRQAAQSVT